MSEENTALSEREAALLARVIAQGAVIEVLFGTFLADRDPVSADAIMEYLRKTAVGPGTVLSDPAAVWWSDAAVLVPQNVEKLIEGSSRVAEGLRSMGSGQPI